MVGLTLKGCQKVIFTVSTIQWSRELTDRMSKNTISRECLAKLLDIKVAATVIHVTFM